MYAIIFLFLTFFCNLLPNNKKPAPDFRPAPLSSVDSVDSSLPLAQQDGQGQREQAAAAADPYPGGNGVAGAEHGIQRRAVMPVGR